MDNVSLHIQAGESVGLVGESGCGKTTLSRLLLRLIAPTSGTVLFRGTDVAAFRGDRLAQFRQGIQPVFQDPFSSLDPRMRVGRIVPEPLRAYGGFTSREIDSRVAEALRQVELEPSAAKRYPAAFSGGQRQRIAIARALISNPKLIILDEAVSSQDVSIRAQMLNLLKDIQQKSGVAYLFISHDLSNVRFLCERLYVMYLGSVVETGPVDAIYRLPRHPYTKMLLESWLPPDPQLARRRQLDSKPSVIMNQQLSGCRFHQRCPLAVDRCQLESPELEPAGSAGRLVACHRAREIPGTPSTPTWTTNQ